jgi:hypothetical protein
MRPWRPVFFTAAKSPLAQSKDFWMAKSKFGDEPERARYAPDGSHLKTHHTLWQALEKRNPIDLANLTLCEPGPGRRLQFPFLGKPVCVDFNDRRLLEKSDSGWVMRDDPLLEMVALVYFGQVERLHPLARAIVGLSELREAHFFVGPHALRLQPLLERFGNDPESLCRNAIHLGGQREDMADAAVCLWPFPRIPLYYLLWQGDDEFEPEIRVLFDRSIDDCLPADAIWALVNRVAQALAAGSAGPQPSRTPRDGSPATP